MKKLIFTAQLIKGSILLIVCAILSLLFEPKNSNI